MTELVMKPLKGKRQLGFSIVELMVSIVIGLIILAGVIQVVFNSKTTFLHQEEMSYIQENARYAMSVIGRDIQNAGYWGCTGSTPKSAFTVAAYANGQGDDDSELMIGTEAITGYNVDTAINFPTLANPNADPNIPPIPAAQRSDSFIVRYADGIPQSVLNHNTGNGSFTLQAPLALNSGGLVSLLAADCTRIGVLAVTNPGTVSTNITANGSNCSSVFKVGATAPSFDCSEPVETPVLAYNPGSVAMNYTSHAYFVENSDVLTGEPALKRLYINNAAKSQREEIALGVEDMSILYSVKSGNGIQLKDAETIEIDSTVSGEDEWALVTAVQVSLLLRSRTPLLQAPEVINYLGNDYNDRYLRQVVTSTFKLRNRI